MTTSVIPENPKRCPLCGRPNGCKSEAIENCWCSQSAIHFPAELLEQVPESLRGKACICKNCLLKYLQDSAS